MPLNTEQQALVGWLRGHPGWHHPNGLALAFGKAPGHPLQHTTSNALLAKLVRLERRGLVQRRVVDGRIHMWQAV